MNTNGPNGKSSHAFHLPLSSGYRFRSIDSLPYFLVKKPLIPLIFSKVTLFSRNITLNTLSISMSARWWTLSSLGFKLFETEPHPNITRAKPSSVRQKIKPPEALSLKLNTL